MHIAHAEVLPNQEAALIQAKSAAFAAKSATTMIQSLHGYVNRIQLPPGIERKRIYARSKGYLDA